MGRRTLRGLVAVHWRDSSSLRCEAMQDLREKFQWGQVEANREVVLNSRGDHGRI